MSTRLEALPPLPVRYRHHGAALGTGGRACGTRTIAPPEPTLLWRKKNVNYYSKYPGDYASDTAHLSLTEHGAYNKLLDYCYGHDAFEIPLYDTDLEPNPVANRSEKWGRIYTICGAVSRLEKAAVRSIVAEFFPDGKNPRVQKQLSEELRRIEKARKNGRKGADIRWAGGLDSKTGQKLYSNPIALATDPANSPPISHSHTNPPTPTPTPTPTANAIAEKRVLFSGGVGGVRAKTTLPAAPPASGGPPKTKSKKGGDNGKEIHIPDVEGLNRVAFAEWDCERRRRGGKSKTSWTQQAQSKTAELLARYPVEEQQRAVDESISSGYAGLFPKSGNGKTFKQIDRDEDEARMKAIRDGFVRRYGTKHAIDSEVVKRE